MIQPEPGSTSSTQSEIVVFYENFSEATSIFQSYRNRVDDMSSQFRSRAGNHGQDMGSTKLAAQYDSGVANALTMLNNLAAAMNAYAQVFQQVSALYEKVDNNTI